MVTELQEALVLMDKDNLLIREKDYKDIYMSYVFREVYFNNGKIYLLEIDK